MPQLNATYFIGELTWTYIILILVIAIIGKINIPYNEKIKKNRIVNKKLG